MVLRVISPLAFARAAAAYVCTDGSLVRAGIYVYSGGSFRPAAVRINV